MAATLIQINRDTQRYDEMLRYVDATFCFCFCFWAVEIHHDINIVTPVFKEGYLHTN